MEFLQFALKGNHKKFWEDLKNIERKTGKNANLMFLDSAFST